MDAISSFFSNIKDKLTNPFFGTLIIVLLLQHWELWFAVFNFDADCTLTDRIYIMQNYISQNITFWCFVLDLLKALVFMTFGYFIIVLTRSIVIWIEHTVMPNITNRIVSENVVLKNLHDEVVKERDENFDKYEEQRKQVREFSKTIDEQISQIRQKDKIIVSNTDEITKLNEKLKSSDSMHKLNDEQEKKIKKLEFELNKETNNWMKEQSLRERDNEELKSYESILFDEASRSFFDSAQKFPPLVIRKVKDLKFSNLNYSWSGFLEVAQKITKKNPIEIKDITLFYEIGLCVNPIDDEKRLTPLGKMIFEYKDVLDKV